MVRLNAIIWMTLLYNFETLHTENSNFRKNKTMLIVTISLLRCALPRNFGNISRLFIGVWGVW